MKSILIFSCSGMFRDVPCSWFYRRPSETYVSHTKPWSRMQRLSESRGGSKVTKPIFSNSRKRYWQNSSYVYLSATALSLQVLTLPGPTLTGKKINRQVFLF